MADLIIIAIIICIVAGIVFYLYKSKKRNGACIGCPCAGQCNNKNGGCQDKMKTDNNK